MEGREEGRKEERKGERGGGKKEDRSPCCEGLDNF